MTKGQKKRKGAKPRQRGMAKAGGADFSIQTMLSLADRVDWSEDERRSAQVFLELAAGAMDDELAVLEWISRCTYRIPIIRSVDFVDGRWRTDVVGCGEPSIVGTSLEEITDYLHRMIEEAPGDQPAVWWQDAIPSGLAASYIVGLFHFIHKDGRAYSVVCYDGVKKIVPLGSDLSRLIHGTFSAVPDRAFQSDMSDCVEAVIADMTKVAGASAPIPQELSEQIRKHVQSFAERILENSDAQSYRIALAGHSISETWQRHHDESVEAERTRHQQAMAKAEQKGRKEREALERQLQGIAKRSTDLALRLNKERKLSSEAAEPQPIQTLGDRVDHLLGVG